MKLFHCGLSTGSFGFFVFFFGISFTNMITSRILQQMLAKESFRQNDQDYNAVEGTVVRNWDNSFNRVIGE